MIEWFDDLKLGMRFKSGEVNHHRGRYQAVRVRIRSAAVPYGRGGRRERPPSRGLPPSGWHTAAIAMDLAVQVQPFGPHPLLGAGVDESALDEAGPRPGDTLHLEGEVVELVPSRTKPQGIARQMDRHNQHGEAVLHLQSHWHRALAVRARTHQELNLGVVVPPCAQLRIRPGHESKGLTPWSP